MKKAKCLFSVLLALVMTLAFAAVVPAYTGQISVADAGTYNYRAYKIFDAAANADGDVTYTISADSKWLGVVYDTTDKASKIAGLNFTPDDADNPTKYTVSELPGFSSADFADALKKDIPDNADPIGFTTNSDQAYTEENLDPGYYLVVSAEDNSFSPLQDRAALTTVLENKQVVIQNKNDMPFDKTVDGKKTEGVQIGDVLDFEIESKVPAIDADETFYSFLISDKMDEGLTFIRSSLEVWIDEDGDGTKDNDEIVTMTATDVPDAILSGDRIRFEMNGKTFELSLDMLERGKTANDGGLGLAGRKIVISYQASVNDKAASVVSENNAVLTYGNDPNNYTVKDTQTKVYVSRIVIDKFENGAPEQKLQDAEFKLVKYSTTGADGTGVDVSGNPSATPYYYKVTKDGNGKVTLVEWAAEESDGTAEITQVDGSAVFTGLEDGIYYLKETAAPAGYTQLTEPIMITVDGSHSMTPGMNDNQIAAILTNIANVANTPGTSLPSTGGIGTTVFYIFGTMLVLGAAVILVIRRRMSVEG